MSGERAPEAGLPADTKAPGGPEAATPPPLHGATLMLVAVALALGTFMQVLDTTIANVSLATIAGNLGRSSDEATWVITAFAAANGATVPLTGWLMRRFGVVTTFLASVTLFSIASALCGLAWSLPSLIVFRLIQGAVSGPMIPGSQSLLLAVFPPERRPLALGIWSVTTLTGPVLGPIMGGYISDHYHWGWIFLINVPVGAVSIAVLWSRLRPFNTPPVKIRLDLAGVALLFLWVAALQVVLDLGKNDDWFNSSLVVVLSIVAGLAFAAWLIWERTDSSPTVDLSLFSNRNFTLGVTALTLGYSVFFASNLLMPLWLQADLGYTATWAGLVAAPSGVVAIVLTPVVAQVSGRMDMRTLATISFMAFAVSFGLRANYTTEVDVWHLVLPIMVQGVAMSVFFASIMTITLDGVPPHKVPSATGIANFLRITGGSFAASIVTTVWDRREALHQSRLVEVVAPGNPAWQGAVAGLNASGMTATQGAAVVTRQLASQAYALASTDIFWISAWLSAVLAGLVWFARRPPPPDGPVAAD